MKLKVADRNYNLKGKNIIYFVFKQALFDICIQHLFKTWRDMRASKRDFDKVINVTEDQVMYALSEQPHTIGKYIV